MVEDQDLEPGVQPLGQHHLLLVAARQVEAERVDAGRADLQPLDPVLGQSAAPRRCRSGRTGVSCAEVAERDVGGDRQEQHQPLDAPLARDVADAGSTASAGRGQTASRLAEQSACRRRAARSRPACGVSSSRPEPMTPAMPRISPAWSLKLDVAVGAARASSPSASSSDLVAERLLQRLAVILGLQAAADHQLVQLGARRPRRPAGRPRPRRPSSRRCGRRAPAPRRGGARRR